MSDRPVVGHGILPLEPATHQDAVRGPLESHLCVAAAEHARDLIGHPSTGQPGTVPAVQPGDMVEIDRIFHDLNKVARYGGVPDIANRVVPTEQVVAR